jgi:hypothetical protein
MARNYVEDNDLRLECESGDEHSNENESENELIYENDSEDENNEGNNAHFAQAANIQPLPYQFEPLQIANPVAVIDVPPAVVDINDLAAW